MRNHLPKKTIILSFLLLPFIVIAQQKPISTDSLFKKNTDTITRLFTPIKPYYIISWETRIPKNVKLIRQLNEKTAIVTINDEATWHSLKKQTRIAPANNQWKFSPTAKKQTNKNNTEQQTWLLTALSLDSLLTALQPLTSQLTIQSVDKPSRTVLVRTTPQFVTEQLLSLKEIIFIDRRAEPHTETGIIGYNRSFHGINAVDYSIPGANGKNIVAGVKEQKMEEADLDLYKRVMASSIAASDKSNHATVISSIIGGAGNSFYDGRGIAYGCIFFPSSFDNLFADDAAILNASKVTVQNHSYGTIVQQFYGAEAVSYDALTWSNKNYIPVFSAGNQGSSFATDGPYANIPGYANLTGNFKMAKNVITVGAIDNKGNIAAESSTGPLYDGRIAPQLIALGPNGSSDAAAVVSGTIAVMQQVYADSNNQVLPAASLIKAVLYNSAEDIYNTGIDYKTGYGLLNSYASIKAIQQKQYDGNTISQDEVWTKSIIIPANGAQLKVTLAWTDTAAIVNNNKAITSDPDLEVIELNTGTIYKPWVLNAAAHIDSLAKQSTRQRDSLNTAEQVSIQLPAAGNYQLRVRGTGIPTASLPFHIAWHMDTLNTFHFTSPQHASDVNRDEDPDLFIRWKTFVADTNQTGNLYISYNRGVDWQLLQASHKLYSNQYSWTIKDTNSTAVLRMQTGFGDFLSNEFIISKVLRPRVDFICTDSFSLSWNKHVYADSYKIFALTDSPYLKHILTVTDTFSVMNRTAYPWLVYAVEPVLNNTIPASRSIALNITLQGVTCFYKTFYYNLLDQNKLDLVLELSAPAYVDSVYFERITPNGQVQQIHGAIKVNGTNFIYHQLVNDVPAGSTYWRARIKLKSGAVIYTDMFTVLTSGQRYIVFYPNPVRRNSMLTYVLQQGIPNNSQLQLFDMNGRLLRKFSEMPGSIDVSAFAAGMIIYKLISVDGKVLERGKIIVQ